MKLKIGHKLLHIKLVSMFIGFGLLVALLSSLLVTGFQTISIFRDFTDNLHEDIKQEFDTEDPDFFYRMFTLDPRRSQSLAHFVERRIPPAFADRIRVTVFTSPRGDRDWREMVSLGGLFPDESLFIDIPSEALDGTIDSESFCIRPFLPGSEKVNHHPQRRWLFRGL